jgi:hypothetical protein
MSEEVKGNEAINTKMAELIELIKDDSGESKPAMLCLVGDDKGVHIAMFGTGEDVSMMTASAMMSNPDVSSVINAAGIMSSMKKEMDETGATLQDMEKKYQKEVAPVAEEVVDDKEEEVETKTKA